MVAKYADKKTAFARQLRRCRAKPPGWPLEARMPYFIKESIHKNGGTLFEKKLMRLG